MGDPDYSIILPVYNQADHIVETVCEYREALQDFPASWEILLVVNGSRDASWERCQELAYTYPGIRAFCSERSGWGHAVCLGLTEALGRTLCYTNSARTSAADLHRLLRYAVNNPQTVIKANRKIRESRQRRLGSLLYNMECRALFDLPYWDINGTPKIFPRDFRPLLRLSRPDDLIDLEFHVICRHYHYPMMEIPILSTQRRGGRSTTRWSSALRLYWGAWRMRQELKKNPILPAERGDGLDAA